MDVTHTLAGLWRAKTAWEDARPYLECVFALAPERRPSSSGEGYRPDVPVDRVLWGG